MQISNFNYSRTFGITPYPAPKPSNNINFGVRMYPTDVDPKSLMLKHEFLGNVISKILKKYAVPIEKGRSTIIKVIVPYKDVTLKLNKQGKITSIILAEDQDVFIENTCTSCRTRDITKDMLKNLSLGSNHKRLGNVISNILIKYGYPVEKGRSATLKLTMPNNEVTINLNKKDEIVNISLLEDNEEYMANPFNCGKRDITKEILNKIN